MYHWKERDNPGHCMNDNAFSVGLGLLLPSNNHADSSSTNSNSNNNHRQQPYYPYFVHAQRTQLRNDCDTFCCKLFEERFGLINYAMQVKPSTTSVARVGVDDDAVVVGDGGTTTTASYTNHNNNSTSDGNATRGSSSAKKRPALCFDRITFPKIQAVRHVYNDEVNRGIRMLRDRSWSVMHEELNSSPWPPNNNNMTTASLAGTNADEDNVDSTHSNGTSTAPTILLFDRTDATTRHLVNASEILSKLQQSYRVTVHRISEEWSNATLLQQAIAFNSHPHILTPHGAHLFNILHARPRTKVLELQCRVHNRRWNMHQQWFAAWGPVVDLDWRVYTETEGCMEDGGRLLTNYSPKNVFVDVERVVVAAAEHFDLRPR